ncbi:MAG: type transport system permease protein [Thermoplasmata archaeon]|jgi:ABC-type transport system involved in multi-copper enzyme maturation permease subunit|nr:type transport system permease protein [Thermoplasmata archaeon]
MVPETAAASGVARGLPVAGNPFWNAVYQVARKELLQHIRTKRLLIIGGVLVLLLSLITLVFGPPFVRRATGGGGLGDVSGENLVLAFYFGIFGVGGLAFTQLLSIVLTADAVCSEWSARTVFLLLSKPVTRTAFVLGKFLGNLATIAGTLVTLFVAFYLVMQPFYDGSPTGGEVGGFFAMLGMVVLGSAAFAAISLFFSTLTRSSITSILLMLSLWLIVFPLLGSVGSLAHLGDNTPPDSMAIQGWRYANPIADMQAGARLLLPGHQSLFTSVEAFTDTLNPFSGAAKDTGVAALVLAAYTLVFVAASVLVVQRRNFE